MSSTCKYCDGIKHGGHKMEYHKDMCVGCRTCINSIIRKFYKEEEETNESWILHDGVQDHQCDILNYNIKNLRDEDSNITRDMESHISYDSMAKHIESLKNMDKVGDEEGVESAHHRYIDRIFFILSVNGKISYDISKLEETVGRVYSKINNEKTEREGYVFKKYEDLIMAEFLQNRLVKTIKKTKRKQK